MVGLVGLAGWVWLVGWLVGWMHCWCVWLGLLACLVVWFVVHVLFVLRWCVFGLVRFGSVRRGWLVWLAWFGLVGLV